MRREVYQQLAGLLALPTGACPHAKALLQRFGKHGLTVEALISIYAQEIQLKVTKSNNAIKHCIPSLLQRYAKGEDILWLSVEMDFPACMLMRRMLEGLLPGASRQVIADILKNPARLQTLLQGAVMYMGQNNPECMQPVSPAADAAAPLEHPSSHHQLQHQQQQQPVADDSRLRSALPGTAQQGGASAAGSQLTCAHVRRLQVDVQRCILADPTYSPLSDSARQAAGHEYELLLAQALRDAGIHCFWTETDLRNQKCYKTPDIRLQVPIAVRDMSSGRGAGAAAWRVVSWIDSKATFGNDKVHKKQLEEQYSTYVNRFGPGLVIYWFGFIDDLNNDPDVLLMDHFPDAQTELLQLSLET